MPKFDLIDEPWLPCMEPDGRPRELGLYETLARAHQLRGIAAATPLEAASILRLLLAVLHRVFPTPNAAAWWQLWQGGRWDAAALGAYLARWRHRFDLFHPDRPFYQARDDRVQPRSIALLFPGMAAASFYNHAAETGDLALSPAAAARGLLVSQTFGLPGICHPQQRLFFNSAPWLVGLVFLVEGDNLFQTMALNLLRYDDNHPLPDLAATPLDAPAWEMNDPFQPDRQLPLGYLDGLTWQNRRVLLLPEEADGALVVRRMTATPALKLAPEFRDPMRYYRLDPKLGRRILLLNEERALWRESATLLNLRHGGALPPVALQWLGEMAENYDLERAARYRLLGVGASSDQAKMNMFRAERLPLPLAYLRREDLVAHLATAIDRAVTARTALFGALKRLAAVYLATTYGLPGGREPDRQDVANLVKHWGADRGFWGALELPFLRLIEELPDCPPEESLDRWRATTRRAAFDALAAAERLAGDGTAALKASAQARRLLAHLLAEKQAIGQTTTV